MRDAQYGDLTHQKKQSTFGMGMFQPKVSEVDMVQRLQQAKEGYHTQWNYTNELRQEFFTQQLPTLLKV